MIAGDELSALLRVPDRSAGPVLDVILRRALSGSRPGDREDGQLVCLAIEGGGMRGAVTAGMCVMLEAAGLTAAFDRVYGVSAGALNGWSFSAGQAAMGATHYQDAASERVVNPIGPLRGRPLVDFDLLFDDVIAARKPLSFERLADGPEFRALATSLETLTLRVLADFSDLHELVQAVRASASLPRFAGAPPVFRGERMADGSLLEPIPFHAAADEGATHVLVLRSRPAGYRRPALTELGGSLAMRDEPGLAALVRGRHETYNRQADELQRSRRCRGARVQQIAVPRHARLVGPLQANLARVTEAIVHGARAMAAEVLTEPVDLLWQPVVRRRSSAAAREERWEELRATALPGLDLDS